MIDKETKEIQDAVKKLKWFNSYHTFEEIGVFWSRDNQERADVVREYNFEWKSVLDYGCNLGKSAILAKKMWASEVFWIDIMADTITLAQRIAKLLTINLFLSVINLNDKDFISQIQSLVGEDWVDISFYFSLHGTKEFHQRDIVFQYILDSTREYIFVEWHNLEPWQKYWKIIISYQNSPYSYQFSWFLRDSTKTKDCGIRPFFVIKKWYSSFDEIQSFVIDSIQIKHRISIWFEGLAGSWKSFYSAILVKKLKENFPDRSIVFIDDLKSTDGAIYLPFGTLYYKLLFFFKKYILRQQIKTLHDAYKLYNIVVISDYRLRKYVKSIDVLISLDSETEETRRTMLANRWNASHRNKYWLKKISSSLFACKNFFMLKNTYSNKS